jgi:hypothetical protein
MDTLIFTKTSDGITVRDGKRNVTFHIKEELKKLGARWNQGVWLFRGVQEISIVKDLMGPCEVALVGAENAKEAERLAEKAQREWLKTPEGRAAIEVAKKKRVTSLFKAGCSWICCAECTIMDEKRHHTSCDIHAEDGNTFRVNGNIYTGN